MFKRKYKKLASILEKKGFITIQQSPHDIRAMCICPTGKVNNYLQNEFLKYLFEIYTNKEIETLFNLLSIICRYRKLYDEIFLEIYLFDLENYRDITTGYILY